MNNPNSEKIISILKKTYPHAKIALKYTNNWELLVSVILSAQCTDVRVNKVTQTLFPKMQKLKSKSQNYSAKFKNIYGQIQEIINFAEIDLAELENDILSTGFYKNKARNIQKAAKIILQKYKGEVPKTMNDIIILSGVARKTANVVLGNAYGVVEGIAVDTHVHRISQRLRLVDPDKIGGKKEMIIQNNGRNLMDYIKDADPNKIEQELMKVIPKEDWFKFTYMVIDHGRSICKAQNPNCQICPLNKLCPASRVN